jgi:hypothetical protein
MCSFDNCVCSIGKNNEIICDNYLESTNIFAPKCLNCDEPNITHKYCKICKHHYYWHVGFNDHIKIGDELYDCSICKQIYDEIKLNINKCKILLLLYFKNNHKNVYNTKDVIKLIFNYLDKEFKNSIK